MSFSGEYQRARSAHLAGSLPDQTTPTLIGSTAWFAFGLAGPT